jgi:hypothetical protein
VDDALNPNETKNDLGVAEYGTVDALLTAAWCVVNAGVRGLPVRFELTGSRLAAGQVKYREVLVSEKVWSMGWVANDIPNWRTTCRSADAKRPGLKLCRQVLRSSGQDPCASGV